MAVASSVFTRTSSDMFDGVYAWSGEMLHHTRLFAEGTSPALNFTLLAEMQMSFSLARDS